jgi:hypothetical protein
VSVPVELSSLAARIDEMGDVAYLVTVSGGDLPHVVSVRARLEGANLVVGAGRKTAANAAEHPAVTLLWPALPGGDYSLIVDGEADASERGGEEVLVIGPRAAVLHRTPAADRSLPSCVTVLRQA